MSGVWGKGGQAMLYLQGFLLQDGGDYFQHEMLDIYPKSVRQIREQKALH